MTFVRIEVPLLANIYHLNIYTKQFFFSHYRFYNILKVKLEFIEFNTSFFLCS